MKRAPSAWQPSCWTACLLCCVACGEPDDLDININTGPGAGQAAEASVSEASRATDAAAGVETSDAGRGTGTRPSNPPSPADGGGSAIEAEVRLDTKVRIGVFKLLLGAAKLTSSTASSKRPQVVVDFTATSLDTESSTPLSGLEGDDLVLTLGAKDLLGTVKAEPVLGGKSGTGTITWLPDASGLAADQLSAAVLTFGSVRYNQAVVKFVDPQSTPSLEDVILDAKFTVSADELTDFELKSAWVTFQDYAENRPLAAGKARMIVETTFSGKADISSSRNTLWSIEHNSLQRPDGAVVHAPLNFVVSAGGTRYDKRLVYELAIPVSGTYTLTLSKPVFNNNGNMPVSKTIVVP
jgi:hypothetical protein